MNLSFDEIAEALRHFDFDLFERNAQPPAPVQVGNGSAVLQEFGLRYHEQRIAVRPRVNHGFKSGVELVRREAAVQIRGHILSSQKIQSQFVTKSVKQKFLSH